MSITLPPPPDATYDIGEGFERIDAYSLVDLQLYGLAAIAADRASRVPMCEAQLRELVPYWLGYDIVEQFGLLELMRAVEAHHGIGAKP